MPRARKRLEGAVRDLLSQKQDKPRLYPGALGAYVAGVEQIRVPGRSDFVYVRLRTSTSEVVEAFNDAVGLHFDLPVLVYRDPLAKHLWRIYARDIGQYEDWGGASYLPPHGLSHSFVGGTGGGSDIVWTQKRQFMPLLARPVASGTMGVWVEPDYYLWDDVYHWWPGSGTSSLAGAKPTGAHNGRFVTIYLDGDDGILGTLNGPEFDIIYPPSDPSVYIQPVPPSMGIPLAAAFLITGTERIGWGELFDLREIVSPPDQGSCGSTTGSIVLLDEGVILGSVTALDLTGGGVIATRHETTGTFVIPNDHGLLTGLTDDDHTQYVLRQPTADTIINESGGDFDWRMEGDTDQNLLFVDAGNDRVGIGTATPSERFHVFATGAYVGRFEYGADGAAILTVASQEDDNAGTVARLDLVGHNSAAADVVYASLLGYLAFRNAGAELGELRFNMIRDGTERLAMRIAGGGEEQSTISFYSRYDAAATIGIFGFYGLDSEGALTQYGYLEAKITDSTHMLESGEFGLSILKQGSNRAALRLTPTGAILNEDGADIDFRVEGDTDPNLLFADAGNDRVGIGTNAPATSAKLEIASTTGALLLPRMTTNQRDALTAANGMILYNTTDEQVQVYEDGIWKRPGLDMLEVEVFL